MVEDLALAQAYTAAGPPEDCIAAIERSGSSGARVILQNGEEVLLRNSNDVDSSNRGIAVSDLSLGQVQVRWGAFEEITFHAAPVAEGGYDAFDGGRPLFGTVETRDGEEFSGYIRWDNDEAYTWEILDGRDGDVDFDVEFGQVRSIRRAGSRGSEVRLLDGRTLQLEGSNDVDEDNKGIFVSLDDGETDVPAGEVGELLMSGPQLMNGYHGMPTETANALRTHADDKVWLHTGDIAYLDAK